MSLRMNVTGPFTAMEVIAPNEFVEERGLEATKREMESQAMQRLSEAERHAYRVEFTTIND